MKNGRILVYPQSPKKIIKKVFVFAFIISCIVITAGLFWGQTRTHREIKAETEDLGMELEALRADNESLKQEIFLLQDEEYIEMQARKHLGMVRPGEKIFSVGD
jgi:cell division protein FtsL